MKQVACAALLAACLGASGSVYAADLSLKDTPNYSPIPETNWSGLYVGAHIGGAWDDTEHHDVNELNSIDPHADVKFSGSHLLAGAQIGYNVQNGNFVYGLEAGLGHMNLGGDASAHMQDDGTGNHKCDGHHDTGGNAQQCALDSKYSISSDLYGELTGRIGYAKDRALFYVKGGAAFLNVDVDANYKANNFTSNDSVFDFSKSEMLFGWTIGAGVEYAISPSWSLKAEYQHFDFGTLSMKYADTHYYYGTIGYSDIKGESKTEVTADAVSVGMNYHF